MSAEEEGAGVLAGLILDLETERQAEGDEQADRLADVLPGVGGTPRPARGPPRRGGMAPLVILALLVALDGLASTAMNSLAPDMARTLGVSAGAMVALAAMSGIAVVLASLPMGWLADRRRRGGVIGVVTLVFAVLVVVAGFATTTLTVFLARVGLDRCADELPVQGSLLADQYPIRSRGRVWASMSMAGGIGVALSPLLVVVADIAGAATDGSGRSWSSPCPSRSWPSSPSCLPEPDRGRQENQDNLRRRRGRPGGLETDRHGRRPPPAHPDLDPAGLVLPGRRRVWPVHRARRPASSCASTTASVRSGVARPWPSAPWPH